MLPSENDRPAKGVWYDSILNSQDHGSLLPELLPAPEAEADGPAEDPAGFPQPGGGFLNFQLIRELGRGAFARVYLAQQIGLADRPVVLKVGLDLWGEVQTLAQLQHSNVVPLYSVHHTRHFQVVCMPYLGSTTLDDVIWALIRRGRLPQTGPELFLLRPAGGEDGTARPVPPAVRTMSYVEAVLWLGARIAEGLAHAHEQGIIHRDLKPANILLADHGQPMLLDFNVAEDVKLRGQVSFNLIGGTMAFMAPEHLAAFGELPTPPLDGRCDLYSLGIILYELLTGVYPFRTFASATPNLLEQTLGDRHRPPPPLRGRNPAVSPAVEAIIQKCLQADPAQRYQQACQLQEDLERQLNHLPLRNATEPSRSEWLAKWVRRHPFLAAWTTTAGLVLLLLAGLLCWLLLTVGAANRRKGRSDSLEQQHRAHVQEGWEEPAGGRKGAVCGGRIPPHPPRFSSGRGLPAAGLVQAKPPG